MEIESVCKVSVQLLIVAGAIMQIYEVAGRVRFSSYIIFI